MSSECIGDTIHRSFDAFNDALYLRALRFANDFLRRDARLDDLILFDLRLFDRRLERRGMVEYVSCEKTLGQRTGAYHGGRKSSSGGAHAAPRPAMGCA